MRQNPERRAALVDAAVEVLAREGARGLTFRAVDTEAAVPNGTASNYFTSRDDLLNQVGRHIHVRLTPDPAEVSATLESPPSPEVVVEFMHALLGRLLKDRSGYLALMELRLEATRRPELRQELTGTIASNLDENIRFHLDSGLPGDSMTVVLLYLAMSGLVVEQLTLPEVLNQFPVDDVIAALVGRTLPPAQ
ncbi:TetR/AcrR family transcriptional regulator [Amycolatopsis sp.]|jgi:DNA-binding transcriptional regulator YbjK|uniref:TetR/AcrR family transcriptional regulator n=1 Tax=Amycolatopsis sp. TaxID=37632 RepID=UPI002E00AA1C|nr:TetR family transcriptional regulator [Amycolatopsis sp.]